MQLENITNCIILLANLHEELLTISKEKTESIKSGNMESLSKLLMQERKQLQAIEQAEEKRQAIVEDIFIHLKVSPKEKTVSELMNYLNSEQDKEQLNAVVARLVNVIVKLREIERLNNDLILQSMQFVQLSLDMLQPSAKSINYNEKSGKQESLKRTVFDSKA